MDRIKQLLKTNHFAFGVVLSLVISLILFSALSLLASLLPDLFSSRFLRREVLALISIFINLFPFRTYLIKLKLEKTGRGILLTMFVLTILYFVFVHEVT